MSTTGEPVGDSTVCGMASPSSPATEGAFDKVVFVMVINMRISNSLLSCHTYSCGHKMYAICKNNTKLQNWQIGRIKILFTNLIQIWVLTYDVWRIRKRFL